MRVFFFSVERYGEKGDILICVFSSSGNSPNIIKAIKAAKTLGMITVSFVGFREARQEMRVITAYTYPTKIMELSRTPIIA